MALPSEGNKSWLKEQGGAILDDTVFSILEAEEMLFVHRISCHSPRTVQPSFQSQIIAIPSGIAGLLEPAFDETV